MAVSEARGGAPEESLEGAAPEEGHETLPAPTEEIHLPDPSYLPVVLAFGITLALTGIVLTLAVTIIGVVIALVALFMWIRKTREEMSELPLDR